MSDSDIRAAMYGGRDDDDDQPAQPPKRVLPTIDHQRARRIMVGPIAYEVPTMDYVRRLESALIQQDKAIKRLTRMLGEMQGRRRAAGAKDDGET